MVDGQAAIVPREPASGPAAYRGLELVATPDEARSRLAELQAFVQTAMVKGEDYDTLPGVDKPTLLQPGAQKLAEIYGLAHQFVAVESVKDWDRGFFYFEYKCILKSRRDGAHVGEGIGSCNSREARYAGRWLFSSELPRGIDKSKLRRRERVSQKTGKPFVQYLGPNEDPYSLVNTIQKMAAKRSYVHAVLAATRSSALFTQDVEDAPEAFSAGPGPSPDAPPPPRPPPKRDAGPAPDADIAVARGLIADAYTLSELKMVWDQVPQKMRPVLVEQKNARKREIEAQEASEINQDERPPADDSESP